MRWLDYTEHSRIGRSDVGIRRPWAESRCRRRPLGSKRWRRELGNDGLNVVVTGGHLSQPDDFLLTASGAERWLPGERIATTSTHGTGCAFSSALLCGLISGLGPEEAVSAAKAYVTEALRSAYPVGKRQRTHESSFFF